MAIGDVWRIIDKQDLFGEEVLNVYFYRETTIIPVGTTEEDIRVVFSDIVLTPMADLQSSSLTHQRLIVENLMNAERYSDMENIIEGANSGDCMPPFVTLSFKLVRTNRTTRNGRKSVGGIPEAAVDGGVLVISVDVEPTEEGLASPLEFGLGGADGTLEPLIVGRNNDGTLDLERTNLVRDAVYTAVSTQNTRKFGRGS